MTTEPQSPSFRGASIAALLVAIPAMLFVMVGTLWALTLLKTDAKGTDTVLLVMAPAAAALGVSICVSVDAARQRRAGRQSAVRSLDAPVTHPTRLVVMLLAATILLLDTVLGVVAGVAAGRLGVMMELATYFLLGGFLALAAFYAAHYLGTHPCRWTAAAVGCAFVGRQIITTLLVASLHINMSRAVLLEGQTATFLMYLIVCVSAAWISRRHRTVPGATGTAGFQQQPAQLAAADEETVERLG